MKSWGTRGKLWPFFCIKFFLSPNFHTCTFTVSLALNETHIRPRWHSSVRVSRCFSLDMQLDELSSQGSCWCRTTPETHSLSCTRCVSTVHTVSFDVGCRNFKTSWKTWPGSVMTLDSASKFWRRCRNAESMLLACLCPVLGQYMQHRVSALSASTVCVYNCCAR
jgi:hypothetical protein